MSDSPTQTLYRFYDGDDQLLYVGISSTLNSRLKNHAKNSDWFFGSAKATFQHFYTRKEVEEAERLAIENEKPKYNIIHSSDYLDTLTHFNYLKEATCNKRIQADEHHRKLIDGIRIIYDTCGFKKTKRKMKDFSYAFFEIYDLAKDRKFIECDKCQSIYENSRIMSWGLRTKGEIENATN